MSLTGHRKNADVDGKGDANADVYCNAVETVIQMYMAMHRRRYCRHKW